MTNWFTSDHHFGHKNIITYCQRPFESVTEMNLHMVDVWNNTVKPSDTVYYLGDFSLSTKVMEQFVPQLNGTKILVAGNHDTCHPCNHNGRLGNLSTYKKYFDQVYEQWQWNDLVLHHIPYWDNDDDRYPEYRPINEGKILVHGHVHQRWVTNGPQINVGVDVWNFEPVHEDQIMDLVRKIESESLQDS